MMKTLFVVVSLAAALGLAMWAHEEFNCRFSGYERYQWYAEGREIGRPGRYSPVEFPTHRYPERYKDVQFQFDYLDRYIECAEGEEAYRLSVVRFSVASPFQFRPLEPAGELKNLNWYEVPANAYVPWSVYKSGANRRSLAATTVAWLPAQSGDRNRAELVNSFEIAWLKGEPLDEAHLMGIWHGGWLFRSSKPGHYVWVN